MTNEPSRVGVERATDLAGGSILHDRLTPLDASFLHLEDESAPLHVAAMLIFEGPAPAYEDFVEHVESRLHLVPRYRQRLARVPLDQGRPVWVDDDRFDVRFHVRATALPPPADEETLRVLGGRVFSQPLTSGRPLWEMWLVDGLDGDRFAVLSKTHHTVVDGISGMDVLSVLFAPDDEVPNDGEPWHPAAPPSGVELLAQTLLDRVTQPAELVRPVRALLRRPARVLAAARDQAIGLGAFAWAGLTPAPRTPYNRDTVGRDRRFAWVRGSLDDFKAVKDSWDGSVNDVVLTVVARALRRHLCRRGEDVDDLILKAFVPVSTRQAGDATGNRVTGMIAPLPIGCEDVRECFEQIRAEMGDIKSSGQAVGARALTEVSGVAPPTLLNQGARLIGRQRFINLVVTNVPGPQDPLYLGDRELLDIFPMVPLGKNLTFNVAIVSYNGRMDFGLIGDFDTMPDLDEVADDFAAAFDEVRAEAGRAEQPMATRPSEAVEPTPAEEIREAVDPETGDVDTPLDLVAEQADPGAEEGAGAEIGVEEPWPGYDRMTTRELVERLHEASDEVAAVVDLYERVHRDRRPVREAAARALSRP